MPAAFGKALCPKEVDRDALAETCATLRVLNNLRTPKVGMPLTWAQLEMVGATAVLRRLLARHEHLLVWRIAEHLRLPLMMAAAVHHWACATIHGAPATTTDDELLATISAKLAATGAKLGAARPRVAEIAAEAHRVGRQRLATRLLEHEPVAAEQVPLLLRIGALPLALAKAIGSGDVELVQLVLLHAKAALPAGELFELLLPHPVAQRLHALYCEAREPEQLKPLFYHVNAPLEAAALATREAYLAPNWPKRMRGLSIALQFYQNQSNAASAEKSKDTAAQCAHLAHAVEEQLKLLDAQVTLTGRPTAP